MKENHDSTTDDDGGGGSYERVEVNQRALIDKILARYASAGAVYRELIQNSNDAEATTAEIYFTTNNSNNNAAATTTGSGGGGSSGSIVRKVVYRNNGMAFRPQDWSRLKKIAEGNPDVSKVGAFGVGAYTMFSICEEPVVLSGGMCLAFVWKGDALWTKTTKLGQNHKHKNDRWTSFVLPSRDPYPLPDMVEFGEFLCASLTFTKHLRLIRVLVDDKERLSIVKVLLQEPRLVTTSTASNNSGGNSNSTASNWWTSMTAAAADVVGGSVSTSSPQGTFYLSKPDRSIMESVWRITVDLDGTVSSLDARYVSAAASTKIPPEMARRMQRVTKKQPPKSVDVQVFLNAQEVTSKPKNAAERITRSFSPSAGAGRIFIGFRTSQTTGLAAHLAAPFVPTVEREAMDLQDLTLRVFNLELLEFCGILMRLLLENTMYHVIHPSWVADAPARLALEEKLLLELRDKKKNKKNNAKKQQIEASESTESNGDKDADNADEGGGGFMGFARFMAKGVTKKIVSVVQSVEQLLDDNGEGELLRPADPRPLSVEERQAIVLMQSFCPMQSTPDASVGTALAQGFSRCMPKRMPPVLTKSGVVTGDAARLPNQGMEAFVRDSVVRSVVYTNAEEYHTVIARCRKINLDDLVAGLTDCILEEEKLITLIQWWTKYSRLDRHGTFTRAGTVKDLVRYYPEGTAPAKQPLQQNGHKKGAAATSALEQMRPVCHLRDVVFFVDKESVLYKTKLPLPPSVMTPALQLRIGNQILADEAMHPWFSPLPMEIWIEYIGHHGCMNLARPEDDMLRLEVWTVLGKEYNKRYPVERSTFAGFCRAVFGDLRCLPFDSSEPVAHAAERPADLYLYSAELDAFDGIGNSFYKVSRSLQSAGVGEEFLLSLGVRKSVSIDFLFAHLHTLQWSHDPKTLIEYLRSATLTPQDLAKLKSTKYLPAEKEVSSGGGTSGAKYAPGELYLPNLSLRIFPFCKMLHWPSESEVSKSSENGKFLVKLGMRTLPSLLTVLNHISQKVPEHDDALRIKCLNFVCDRLGPQGVYHDEYARMRPSQKVTLRILPCITQSPLTSGTASDKDGSGNSSHKRTLCSPLECYSERGCGIMGFPVLDPKLGKNNAKLYASLFQCSTEPASGELLQQLQVLVATAKSLQKSVKKGTADEVALNRRIETTFDEIFKYLSHRSSEFTRWEMDQLASQSFIPCKVAASEGNGGEQQEVQWFRPEMVFFRQQDSEDNADSSLTAELFQTIPGFSPFLAAAGVKQEATTKDLFDLMLKDPKRLLEKLGEKKYRALLRRIAASPPFHRVTDAIRNAPFLLAYKLKTNNTKGTPAGSSSSDDDGGDSYNYHLAKASDILIIDNSFFGRMFSVVLRAPHESDLEDFYHELGSNYISKSVDRRFEVVGSPSSDTPLTLALGERLKERRPLLTSPNITSRPLVRNAASVLNEDRVSFFQASNLMAVYSLHGAVRRNRTTCFSRATVRTIGAKKHALYVVEDFDWFDVGYAIGDMILERCQLEDAFFISSLLEAPVEQLRARGFPVDRIMKPEPPPEPKKQPPAPAAAAAAPAAAAAAKTAKPATATPAVAAAGAAANGHKPAHAGAAKAAEIASQQPKVEDNNDSSSPTKAASPTKATSPTKGQTATSSTNDSNDGKLCGLVDNLKQMFPDVDAQFLRKALEKDPSLANAQSLAEKMMQGKYPRDKEKPDGKDDKTDTVSEAGTVDTAVSSGLQEDKSQQQQQHKKRGFRKKFHKAFGGLRPSSFGGVQPPAPVAAPPGTAAGPGGGGMFVPPSAQETRTPVSPAADAQTQDGLERMLENTVGNSGKVNRAGIQTQDTNLTSIPEGLDRGETCEVLPGQSLKPYGRTQNGILVFSWSQDSSSEAFLRENRTCLDNFSVVVDRLCGVYGLAMDSVAIYHDPTGKTVAFNSGRAVHLNVRFFHSIYFLRDKPHCRECYSYWYVTLAHELAHHFVSAHNKEHGFYTESYTSTYLPKLMDLLRDIQAA